MSFTIPRTAILRNITAFLSHDNSLLANSVIKWKCIASEFRAILIRLGISQVYAETFQAVQAAAMRDDIDKQSVVAVAEDHKSKAEEFMGNRGQAVLSCLLQQSAEQISSVLEPSQLVLEYCFVQEDSDEGSSKTHHPSGVLVAMQAQAQVQIFSIDFTKALPLASKWAKMLSDPDRAKDTKELAEELCTTLIPPVISSILDADPKKQVFLCPDVSLTVIPLELLLFKDGKTLGEKCTTTYMSSSREFLRNAVIKAVSYFDFDNSDEKLPEISGSNLAQSISDNVATMTEAKPSDLPKNEEISPSTNDKDFPKSQEGTKQEMPPPQKESECIVVAAPNFDLEKPATQAGLWGGIIQGFASLFSSKPVEESEDIVGAEKEAMGVKRLVGAEKEAMEVEKILSESIPHLKIQFLMNDDATLAKVLTVQSPLILHFSTHGFSQPERKGYHSSFWDDTHTGLLLAGANIYRQGRLEQIATEAGTGKLTALAACGMNLRGTRLVYLNACVSSYGRYSYNESINSLAEAFRSAGAETIIATLWQVVDDTARKFAGYFYSALCSSGTTCTPSQALTLAKKKLQDETSYKHWIYWSSFICIGEDKPVFRTN